MSDPREFRVHGTVEEAETGRPLAGLIVRAFDRDLVFDDKIGFATTDGDGRFEIRFGADAFSDWREARPDLYLRVFDAEGIDVVQETRDAIRWNASPDEEFRIRVPARALAGRRAGTR